MKSKNLSHLERIKRQIEQEIKEQNAWRSECINLIASENIMSKTCERAYVSDFMHRYAEGEPYKRYYQGTKYIDDIESIAQELMGELLHTSFTDVRPISGTIANYAALSAFTKPCDAVFSLATAAGGHISHNPVGAPGVLGLDVHCYPFDNEIFNIDIDKATREIIKTKPKVLILGASLFLFPHPVEEIKSIAEEVGAVVMYDAAHVLGLIMGGEFQNPIREGADIITSSTHKTFPGPQGGLVATNHADYFKGLKRGVFPRLTSNHHLHRLPALALTALEFLNYGEAYAKQTVKNAKTLAEECYSLGLPVICEHLGFTKSHQVVMDVKKLGISSKEAVENLERANIITNKNLLPWDTIKQVHDPSGIRFGVQEMTRFGMKESEMRVIAEFLKNIILDKEDPEKVKEDVVEFRREFQEVKYGFNGER
ncbi:MAG: serine hydroxymethyltransferase [Candidatus Aenigmatarchaeota archaeon]|nr:MAG: serine hydroxymethyltransferase [Candidatus Aenigmarchaeota archaeon]